MNFNKKGLTHLLPIAIFFIIVCIYFAPLYSGKVLVQSDNVQLTGVNKEVAEYRENGEQIHWNNREFSGVPLLATSNYNPLKFLNQFFFYGIFPKAIMMVFFLFAGFYILMQVFGVSRWLSAIGAFAYAFSTFNIISIEVGHDNKVLAIAFMAPVLAGIILAYRGELLKGGVLTMIAAGFQLYYGHIQITYYLLIVVLGYIIVVLVQYFKSGDWLGFLKASGVLLAATVVAFGCNFGKLYATLEYSDYSTRGGSELKENQEQNVSSKGLDKDYALAWSNGVLETLTLVFPYFHGGASGESLDKDTETYETLASRGVDRQTIRSVTQRVPLYWGDQPFTGGPIYLGAIICMLFVLSLFVLEGPVKWWGLGLTVLSLLLAMGKNLEWFTDIFFYYVPLYNKFRTVTMILSITQLFVPLMAFLALDKIIRDHQSIKKADKKVLQAGGIIVGVGIFFLLFKGSFFDFAGRNDAAYGFPQWLVDAIVSDRKNLFNTDIIRSIIFIALAVAGLWLYLKKTLKLNYLVAGMALLVLIDLWTVNKRYLGSDDFDSARKMTQQAFQPTSADQQILQDDSYFRVLNLAAQNPFSDGLTSYHHYSILGYNAIKMQRYQELIDRYISKVDQNILNMLNAKYIISKGQNGPVVQKNANALGNAWLVKNLEVVENADEELEKVGEIDLANEAVVDESFAGRLDKQEFSGQGSITFKDYHPERMSYQFTSEADQFVVFSEIYYGPGWQAYIDGKEVPHVRVDYVLRGLEVPAGSHEIVFKYEPFSITGGNKIIIASTILMVLGVGLMAVRAFRKSGGEESRLQV